MKKLASLTFALLLTLTLLVQPVVIAQNRKAASSRAVSAGQYAKQIREFHEFARKHMKALETNSNYPNAAGAKEVIKKLTDELAANPARP